MTDRCITTETRGRVYLIGLDRADARNRFDTAMIRGLVEAYTELATNPELWCGVVFAHGADFTFGLDLAEVAPRLIGGGIGAFLEEGQVDPWAIVTPRCPKPIVVATHGRCFTAGIELSLAADIVVASEGTLFGQMEVARGILALGGATFRMPAAFGWHNAMRYLLTGDMFDAEEARRIGFVQEITPAGEQLSRAVELAESICRNAPLAVQATIANADLARREGIEAAGAALIPALRELFKTSDAREGVLSLVQKRPAKFTGE